MSVKQTFRTYAYVIVMLTAAVLLVASARPIHALENSVNTLKVTPVRTDLEIKPGETKTVKATVTNLTNNPIVVHPSENDFIAGDERGTPSLILDEAQFAPTHSLKRFMSPLKDVTIPAKGSATIDVVIKAPANAQAGGYYGAIRFAPSAPDSGGQVNLSASVASLILATVPGALVEKLDLTDFTVQQKGKTASFFNSPEGIKTSFRFQNQGNVQVGPFGKLTVKQGNKVIYDVDFNNKDPRDQILPDSARRWDIPLEKLGTFGNYTVTATLTYGKQNQTVEVSKSFWIVPVSLIIAAVVGVIVLIGLIVGIWFFLRSYKRRILRSSGGSRGGYSRR